MPEAFFIYKTVKNPAQSLQCRLWAASFRQELPQDGGGSTVASFSLWLKLEAKKHARMYAFDRDSKGVSPLVAANRMFAQNTSHEFFAKQKHSKLKNVQDVHS